MKYKLASVLIGLLLATTTGTVVYVKKNTSALPVPNLGETSLSGSPESQISDTPFPSTTASPTGINTSTRTREYGDDDDDDYVTTSAPPTQIPTPTPAPTQTTTKTGISMTTIAQHSSRSSCWSAINGSVYDLTSWIPNHPGGEQAILSLCGHDGSTAFNNQHGGQSKPTAILAGFKIGTLQ